MRSLIILGLVVTVGVNIGCDTGHSGESNRPQTSQTNGMNEYGDKVREVGNALEKLTSQRNTIGSKLRTWERIPPSTDGSGGPTFGGEQATLAAEIVRECDALESGAKALKRNPHLRDHSGAGPKLDQLIDFARGTRNRVSR